MKLTTLFIPLLLFCITGCAQKDQHNFHMPGKIPIEGKRWYQVTNATTDMSELFDNNQFQKVNTGYNKLVPHYDAWYPLQDGEQMIIDSIMMYCWRGIDAEHPVTIYAVMADWKRVPIAVFKGQRATTWEGPDPDKPGVFALVKPVSGMRYLVINSWGEFPGEIEFYGKYTTPAERVYPALPPVALSNYLGINAYEWNFEDEHKAAVLDPVKLTAIQNFTAVRHYLDWGKLEATEGNYTFNPTHDGGWDYDAMYQWCKDNKTDVLACLKTIPKWMEETYPADKRNYENIPARYGKDLGDPASYTEQAKVAFQFAARYGRNKNINAALLKVDSKPRWNGDKVNAIRTGLDLVHYIECDNERDKWWKGRTAYQTGREYAANLSAFYDGHKGKLGPGVGVKNADPNMQVVMGGLADPSTGYIMGMVDWCKENRGYKKDGSVDVPWDVINYHYYANDGTATKEATTGVAPEKSSAGTTVEDFVQFSARYCGSMPVWVTEAGYDVNQQSIQRAVPVKDKSVLQTQADWILRTSLLYARNGIGKVFYYQLYDDNAASTIKYGTSGLANDDHSNRPAADYLAQVNKQFGNATFIKTISTDPNVDEYAYRGKKMYALWVPDATGRTAEYKLDAGNATNGTIYQPVAGSRAMKATIVKTVNGKLTITVTETPQFLLLN